MITTLPPSAVKQGAPHFTSSVSPHSRTIRRSSAISSRHGSAARRNASYLGPLAPLLMVPPRR